MTADDAPADLLSARPFSLPQDARLHLLQDGVSRPHGESRSGPMEGHPGSYPHPGSVPARDRGSRAAAPRGGRHSARPARRGSSPRASGSGAPVPWVHELDREYVSDRYEIIRHGGGGDLTEMMCCAVSFDHPAGRTLIAPLPRLILRQGRPRLAVHRMAQEYARSDDCRGQRVARAARRSSRAPTSSSSRRSSPGLDSDPAAQSGRLGALRDRQWGAIAPHPPRPGA